MKGFQNRTIAGQSRRRCSLHQLPPGNWHLGDWRSVSSAPTFWNEKMLFKGRIASQTNADGGILFPLRESAQCFSFRVINSNTSCLYVRLPLTHDFMYAGTLGSNNTEKWVGHLMHHSFHRFPTGACYVPAWVPWEHGRGRDLEAAALGYLAGCWRKQATDTASRTSWKVPRALRRDYKCSEGKNSSMCVSVPRTRSGRSQGSLNRVKWQTAQVLGKFRIGLGLGGGSLPAWVGSGLGLPE